MLRRFAAVFFLLGVVSFCGGQEVGAGAAGDGLKTPSDYFKSARRQADLHQDGAPAFQLKAGFTVTDDQGHARTGDYSELWVAKDRWRRDIGIGDYHETMSCVSGDYYHLATSEKGDIGVMDLLDNIAPAIPYPRDDREWAMKTEKLSGAEFTRVSHKMHFDDRGDVADAAYVFTPQTGILRASATVMEQTSYNDLHSLLGRVVPFSVSVKFIGVKRALSIHVLSFESAGTPTDSAFVIPGASKGKCNEAGGFLESESSNPMSASSGVIAGMIQKRVNPIYPVSAREARVGGTVTLRITINRLGQVRNVRIIHSPREDLAAAAIIAVRQFVYKPFLLNGAPTDVDGVITVNFVYRDTR